MYQTIVDAMQALAESERIFGLEDSRKGEKQFQSELNAKLVQMTTSDAWSWRREENFKTRALTNDDRIAIDIVGRHPTKGTVAIELKYVVINAKRGKPSDPPAFSWDVAKDCLKLDLLRACLCEQAVYPLPDPNRLQTYVIGMTNFADYWQKNKSWGGWAKHSLKAARATRFERIILETDGRNNDTSIYTGGRCHIAFGQPWIGEWRPYLRQFQYLFLRPESDVTPQWTHHLDRSIDAQSRIIPFLNIEAREIWDREYKSRADKGDEL
jgi:hypothetical protein